MLLKHKKYPNGVRIALYERNPKFYTVKVYVNGKCDWVKTFPTKSSALHWYLWGWS